MDRGADGEVSQFLGTVVPRTVLETFLASQDAPSNTFRMPRPPLDQSSHRSGPCRQTTHSQPSECMRLNIYHRVTIVEVRNG